MSDGTVLLDAIQSGDPEAPEQLLPLVYEDLCQLATHRLARETPGQTLEPAALVHEAYLRLVGEGEEQHWDSRGHSILVPEGSLPPGTQRRDLPTAPAHRPGPRERLARGYRLQYSPTLY